MKGSKLEGDVEGVDPCDLSVVKVISSYSATSAVTVALRECGALLCSCLNVCKL